MPRVALTDSKENRVTDAIHLRIRRDLLDLISEVSERNGLSRSDFIRTAALEKAYKIMNEQNSLSLIPNEFDAFAAWLQQPPAPTEKLRRIMTEGNFDDGSYSASPHPSVTRR